MRLTNEKAIYKRDAIQEGLNNSAKTATNYLSIDNTGIMVADLTDGVETPSTATGRNVFIDNDSVDVRKGQIVLASFGEITTIGESTSSHIELRNQKITAYTNTGSQYYAVGDLKGTETTHTYYGDGSTTEFGIFHPTSTPTVTIDGVVTTDFTLELNDQKLVFTTAPADGAVIVITYIYEDTSPYFTFGKRKSSSNVMAWSVAMGDNCEASGLASMAFGRATVSNSYVSTAFGSETVASGIASFAEGYNTTASGYGTHAEGGKTIASFSCSHAEGLLTTASGNSSHAEGGYTTASGICSHAEGNNTTASGKCSHAEGSITKALGNYSHASGRSTIANYEQTVIGRYNVANGSADSFTDLNYAFIIGNGTSDTDRSNAFAVRWSGTVRTWHSSFSRDETVTENTVGGGFYIYNNRDNKVCDGWFGAVKLANDTKQGTEIYATRTVNNADVYNGLRLLIDDSGNKSVQLSESAPWRTALGLDDLFMSKRYTYAYTVNANSIVAITGNNLGTSTPSGYTGFSIRYVTTGNGNVIFNIFNPTGTGTANVCTLRNVASSQQSGTLTIDIWYIKTAFL